MRVQYTGELRFYDFRAAFPYQSQAPIVVTDLLSSIHPVIQSQRNNCRFDPYLGLLRASEIFLPHDNCVTGSLPGSVTLKDSNLHLLHGSPGTGKRVNWAITNMDGIAASTDYYAQCFRDRAGWMHQVLDIKPKNNSDMDTVLLKANATLTNAQGFDLFYSRGLLKGLGISANNYVNVYFKVNNVWYGVQIVNRHGVKVVYSEDNEVTYRPVHMDMETGSPAPKSIGSSDRLNPDGLNHIKIRCLGSQVMIQVDGSKPVVIPMVIPKTDPDDPNPPLTDSDQTISTVKISVLGFSHFSWSGHITKWATDSSYRSAPQQMGFVPDATTPPYYYIHNNTKAVKRLSGVVWNVPYPTGSSITVTTVASTLDTAAPQHDVALTNPTAGSFGGQNYADRTAVLSKVQTAVDGIVVTSSTSPVVLPLDPTSAKCPIEIVERSSFDPASLTISHTLELTFSNFNGIDDFLAKTGVAGSGNVGVQLDLGYPHLGNFRRFTGYCTTYTFRDVSASQRYLTLTCTDRMQILREAQIIAPPIIDKYNHYYAMALLAQQAGWTMDRIGWASLVPADPFDSVPADTSAYFLPAGFGGNTWTPINRALPIIELMDSIRKLAGFMLYVDENDVLQYVPFAPSSTGAPVRIFREYAEDAYGLAGGALNEMRPPSTLQSSVLDTRNQVVIMGLDPYMPYQAYVAKREDTDSIDAPSGSQPKNYKGYRSLFLWFDSRFANQDFASDTADRMFRLMRQPQYSASINVWMQPDLYVLDVIGVDNTRVNSAEVPFYIFDLENRIIIGGEKVDISATITGRFIDPEVFA